MRRFMDLKQNEGKAEAYIALQRDFALSAHILCPFLIPLKDLMGVITDLEKFTGKSDTKGKSPEQIIRSFLRTNMIEGESIPAPYPDTVVDSTDQTMSISESEG